MNTPFASAYQDVQAIIFEHDASAAEAHGMLSGLLCLDARIQINQWLDKLLGAPAPTLLPADKKILEQLCDETRAQLAALDFSYNLLLPDDDATLPERAQALSEWCQGFLMGLGYSPTAKAEWPGDTTEILEDLLQIAALDSVQVDESDEADFLELAEYIRASVQLIHTEMEHISLNARTH